ncbi:unnamed protein product [Oncorhynchus mykiss]|uniref:CHRD domain-containing protein n=1 Tax=Oncorhynchus mykiss TaxID=8022 RepID=A0A060XL50_ONCMY|nr:unnamed protein product [Oncorhynchus mykiss]
MPTCRCCVNNPPPHTLCPWVLCCTCPGEVDRKQAEAVFDGFEYFQEKEKEDDLHKSYNDRSYLSSEDISSGESRTDFVAVLTGVTGSWLPSSSGVARARFSLTRTSLTFSITYQRIERPSRVAFLDSDGNTAFEYKTPMRDSDMVRDWNTLYISAIYVFVVCLCVCECEKTGRER